MGGRGGKVEMIGEGWGEVRKGKVKGRKVEEIGIEVEG